MQIIVFEDQHTHRLAPVTLARSAMTISCGGYRLIDLLIPLADRYAATLRAIVRPYLRAMVAADYPTLVDNTPCTEPLLLVNARTIPTARGVNDIERMFRDGKAGIVRSENAIVAARLSSEVLANTDYSFEYLSATLEQAALPTLDADAALFEYPHDIVRHNETIIGDNLEHRIACGNYQQASNGVFLAESDETPANIADTAVFDSSRGPVVIESNTSLGAHTNICGPCFIGRGAKVAPGTSLKGWVSLGHTTKAGGEIEGAILEPYTNKQHEGVLGYSYLGSWINIGAGTNQSDLKNTYGSIRVDYGSGKVDTEMQFLGCIMGDYAKTAINTGIFTGKTIGVASMLYGMVTRNVPSFVNYAQSLGQQGEIPASVAVTTQLRMFARRGVEQRECDEQLLRDLFDITKPARANLGLSTDPLEF